MKGYEGNRPARCRIPIGQLALGGRAFSFGKKPGERLMWRRIAGEEEGI